MSFEIAFLLVLFAGAFILLATEVIPPEVTALCLVALLAGSGIMSAEEAFAGFASETIVILACVMILSRRLSESGVMTGLSARLAGPHGRRPTGVLARLMATTAALSTVFSNTTTTAVMMPLAIGAAKRVGTPAGRFLMPMAFASMMGGSATLIGTSANLAANGAVTRMGLEPFAMFEFLWVGLAVSVAGILAVAAFGDMFAPSREADDGEERPEERFLAGLAVPEDSEAADTAFGDLDLGDGGIELLAVDTAEGRVDAHPLRKVRVGDRILVRASRAALERLLGDSRFEVDGDGGGAPARAAADAILLPGSRWIGMTVAAMRRALGPEAAVIGLHRGGQKRAARIGRMRLRAGDILHLVGLPEALARVDADVDIFLVGEAEPVTPSRREGRVTLATLVAAIAAGASGLLPLSVALTVGVLALILAGRMSLREAFAMVSWRILVLIGGMSSFGVALLETGTAEWLADGLLHAVAPLGQGAVLVALSLLTVALTQPLSNAAAALAVLPIAVATAEGLGVDPRPLAVLVTLSASLSFIAPLEPALLLVYGKGKYRLRDFVIAGLPLTAISLTIVLLLVPRLWPL